MAYPYHSDSMTRGASRNDFNAPPYDGKQYDVKPKTRFATYPLQDWPEKEKVNRKRMDLVSGGSMYDCRSTYPEEHVLLREYTPPSTDSPPRGDVLKAMYDRADLPAELKEIVEVPAWLLYTKNNVLQPLENITTSIVRFWTALDRATQPGNESLYDFVPIPVPFLQVGHIATQMKYYVEQCCDFLLKRPIVFLLVVVPAYYFPPRAEAHQIGETDESSSEVLESVLFLIVDFLIWIITAPIYIPLVYIRAVVRYIFGTTFTLISSSLALAYRVLVLMVSLAVSKINIHILVILAIVLILVARSLFLEAIEIISYTPQPTYADTDTELPRRRSRANSLIPPCPLIILTILRNIRILIRVLLPYLRDTICGTVYMNLGPPAWKYRISAIWNHPYTHSLCRILGLKQFWIQLVIAILLLDWFEQQSEGPGVIRTIGRMGRERRSVSVQIM